MKVFNTKKVHGVVNTIVTIVIIVAFLSESTLCYAIPNSQIIDTKIQPLTINNKPLTDFYIPSYYGEIVRKSSSIPDVILISDAHCNYEAQKNIAGILKILLNQYGVGFIGVEGAKELVDVTRFNKFKDEKKKGKVLDRFVKEGYVTGPEFLKIVKGEGMPVELYGVEDTSLYKANFSSLKECIKKWDEWEGVVNKAKEVLKKLKLKIYNPALVGFDEIVNRYWEGDVSFTSFVSEIKNSYMGYLETGEFKNLGLIINCMDLENGIDFKKVEKEREGLLSGFTKELVGEDIQLLTQKSLEYRLGKIGAREYYGYISQYTDFNDTPNLKIYVDLINKYDEVNKDILFDEIEKAIEEIYSVIAHTDIEKELIILNKDLFILDKATHLRLSAKEYEYYKNGLRKDLLTRIIPTSIDLLDVDNFYIYATQRDSVLLENLLMHKGASRAVMITGGFHTDGITKLLEAKNISYAVVRPRITEINGDGIYFSLLKETIGNENLALPTLTDVKNEVTRAVGMGQLAEDVGNEIIRLLDNRQDLLKYLVDKWHTFPETMHELFIKEYGEDLIPLFGKEMERLQIEMAKKDYPDELIVRYQAITKGWERMLRKSGKEDNRKNFKIVINAYNDSASLRRLLESICKELEIFGYGKRIEVCIVEHSNDLMERRANEEAIREANARLHGLGREDCGFRYISLKDQFDFLMGIDRETREAIVKEFLFKNEVNNPENLAKTGYSASMNMSLLWLQSELDPEDKDTLVMFFDQDVDIGALLPDDKGIRQRKIAHTFHYISKAFDNPSVNTLACSLNGDSANPAGGLKEALRSFKHFLKKTIKQVDADGICDFWEFFYSMEGQQEQFSYEDMMQKMLEELERIKQGKYSAFKFLHNKRHKVPVWDSQEVHTAPSGTGFIMRANIVHLVPFINVSRGRDVCYQTFLYYFTGNICAVNIPVIHHKSVEKGRPIVKDLPKVFYSTVEQNAIGVQVRMRRGSGYGVSVEGLLTTDWDAQMDSRVYKDYLIGVIENSKTDMQELMEEIGEINDLLRDPRLAKLDRFKIFLGQLKEQIEAIVNIDNERYAREEVDKARVRLRKWPQKIKLWQETCRGIKDGRREMEPEVQGTPPGMVGWFWKIVIPWLKKIGISDRVIAALGGLEEIFFSGVLVGGVAIGMGHLVSGGFIIGLIAGSILSILLFRLLHLNQIYRLVDGVLIPDKPIQADISIITILGIILRIGYFLSAVFLPFGELNLVFALLFVIILHSSYNFILAQKFHIPLGMAGVQGMGEIDIDGLIHKADEGDPSAQEDLLVFVAKRYTEGNTDDDVFKLAEGYLAGLGKEEYLLEIYRTIDILRDVGREVQERYPFSECWDLPSVRDMQLGVGMARSARGPITVIQTRPDRFECSGCVFIKDLLRSRGVNIKVMDVEPLLLYLNGEFEIETGSTGHVVDLIEIEDPSTTAKLPSLKIVMGITPLDKIHDVYPFGIINRTSYEEIIARGREKSSEDERVVRDLLSMHIVSIDKLSGYMEYSGIPIFSLIAVVRQQDGYIFFSRANAVKKEGARTIEVPAVGVAMLIPDDKLSLVSKEIEGMSQDDSSVGREVELLSEWRGKGLIQFNGGEAREGMTPELRSALDISMNAVLRDTFKLIYKLYQFHRARPQGMQSCPVDRESPYYSDNIKVNGVDLGNPTDEVRRVQHEVASKGVASGYRVIEYRGKNFIVRESLLTGLGYSEEAFLALLSSALAREKEIEKKKGDKFSFESLPNVMLIEEMSSSPYLGADCIGGNRWIGINRAICEIQDKRARDLLFSSLLMHELWHEANPGKEIESFLEEHDGMFIASGIVSNPILTPKYFYMAVRRVLAIDNNILHIIERGNISLIERLMNDLSSPDEAVRASSARKLILLGNKGNPSAGMLFKGPMTNWLKWHSLFREDGYLSEHEKAQLKVEEDEKKRQIYDQLISFRSESEIREMYERFCLERGIRINKRMPLNRLINWLIDVIYDEENEIVEGRLYIPGQRAIDIKGKRFCDLPIWPVDESGQLQLDLVKWIWNWEKSDLPQGYKDARKISLRDFCRESVRATSSRQPELPFGPEIDLKENTIGERTVVVHERDFEKVHRELIKSGVRTIVDIDSHSFICHSDRNVLSDSRDFGQYEPRELDGAQIFTFDHHFLDRCLRASTATSLVVGYLRSLPKERFDEVLPSLQDAVFVQNHLDQDNFIAQWIVRHWNVLTDEEIDFLIAMVCYSDHFILPEGYARDEVLGRQIKVLNRILKAFIENELGISISFDYLFNNFGYIFYLARYEDVENIPLDIIDGYPIYLNDLRDDIEKIKRLDREGKLIIDESGIAMLVADSEIDNLDFIEYLKKKYRDEVKVAINIYRLGDPGEELFYNVRLRILEFSEGLSLDKVYPVLNRREGRDIWYGRWGAGSCYRNGPSCLSLEEILEVIKDVLFGTEVHSAPILSTEERPDGKSFNLTGQPLPKYRKLEFVGTTLEGEQGNKLIVWNQRKSSVEELNVINGRDLRPRQKAKFIKEMHGWVRVYSRLAPWLVDTIWWMEGTTDLSSCYFVVSGSGTLEGYFCMDNTEIAEIAISPENKSGMRYKGVGHEIYAYAFRTILDKYDADIYIYEPSARTRGILKVPSGERIKLPRQKAERFLKQQQKRVSSLFEDRISLISTRRAVRVEGISTNTRLGRGLLELAQESIDYFQSTSQGTQLQDYLYNLLDRPPNNRAKNIILKVAKSYPSKGKKPLGHNSARYFDRDSNTIVIVFDEAFIELLLRKRKEHPEAVAWIFSERLRHELCHDNEMRDTESEKEEELDVIVDDDLPIHEQFVCWTELENKIQLFWDTLEEKEKSRVMQSKQLFVAMKQAVGLKRQGAKRRRLRDLIKEQTRASGGRWEFLQERLYNRIGFNWIGQALAPAIIESGLVALGTLLLVWISGIPLEFTMDVVRGAFLFQFLWHILHKRNKFSGEKVLISGISFAVICIILNLGIVSFYPIVLLFASLIIPHFLINLVVAPVPEDRLKELADAESPPVEVPLEGPSEEAEKGRVVDKPLSLSKNSHTYKRLKRLRNRMNKLFNREVVTMEEVEAINKEMEALLTRYSRLNLREHPLYLEFEKARLAIVARLSEMARPVERPAVAALESVQARAPEPIPEPVSIVRNWAELSPGPEREMGMHLQDRFEPGVVEDLVQEGMRLIRRRVLKGGAAPEQLAEYLAILKENNFTGRRQVPVRLIYYKDACYTVNDRDGRVLGRIPNLIVLKRGHRQGDGLGYEHIKKRHLDDFKAMEMDEEEILDWLVKTIREGDCERYTTIREDRGLVGNVEFNLYRGETGHVYKAIVSAEDSTVITFYPEYYQDGLSATLGIPPEKCFILMKRLTGRVPVLIDRELPNRGEIEDVIIGFRREGGGRVSRIKRRIYYYPARGEQDPCIGVWDDKRTEKTMLLMDFDGNVFDEVTTKSLKRPDRVEITRVIYDSDSAYLRRNEGGVRKVFHRDGRVVVRKTAGSVEIDDGNVAVATAGMYTRDQHDKTNEKIRRNIAAKNYQELSFRAERGISSGIASASPRNDVLARFQEVMSNLDSGTRQALEDVTLFLLSPEDPEHSYYLRTEMIDGRLEYQVAHAGSFQRQGRFVYLTPQAFMELPMDIILCILQREARLAKERYEARRTGNLERLEQIGRYDTDVGDILNRINANLPFTGREIYLRGRKQFHLPYELAGRVFMEASPTREQVRLIDRSNPENWLEVSRRREDYFISIPRFGRYPECQERLVVEKINTGLVYNNVMCEFLDRLIQTEHRLSDRAKAIQRHLVSVGKQRSGAGEICIGKIRVDLGEFYNNAHNRNLIKVYRDRAMGSRWVAVVDNADQNNYIILERRGDDVYLVRRNRVVKLEQKNNMIFLTRVNAFKDFDLKIPRPVRSISVEGRGSIALGHTRFIFYTGRPVLVERREGSIHRQEEWQRDNIRFKDADSGIVIAEIQRTDIDKFIFRDLTTEGGRQVTIVGNHFYLNNLIWDFPQIASDLLRGYFPRLPTHIVEKSNIVSYRLFREGVIIRVGYPYTDIGLNADERHDIYGDLCAGTPFAASLSDAERGVLEMRLGSDTREGQTLEEIGEARDVTRERIRQIEAAVLRKWRLAGRALNIESVGPDDRERVFGLPVDSLLLSNRAMLFLDRCGISTIGGLLEYRFVRGTIWGYGRKMQDELHGVIAHIKRRLGMVEEVQVIEEVPGQATEEVQEPSLAIELSDEFLDRSVNSIFRGKAAILLRKLRIRTLGDVLRLSEEDVLSQKGYGGKTVAMINSQLQALHHGLHLGMLRGGNAQAFIREDLVDLWREREWTAEELLQRQADSIVTLDEHGEVVFDNAFVNRIKEEFGLGEDEISGVIAEILRIFSVRKERYLGVGQGGRKQDIRLYFVEQSKAVAGDCKDNEVAFINLRAIKELMGRYKEKQLLPIYLGIFLSHEILGHEVGIDDESILTRQDVELFITCIEQIPLLYDSIYQALLGVFKPDSLFVKKLKRKLVFARFYKGLSGEYKHLISLGLLCKILSTGKMPKEWPRLRALISREDDFELIRKISVDIESAADGTGLTDNDKSFIIEAIAISSLMSATEKRREGEGYIFEKIKADLDNMGYGKKADEIIGELRRIEGRREAKQMSRVDYDFIMVLEKFLGYARGTISTRMNVHELNGTPETSTQGLAETVKSNLNQWGLLGLVRDKQPRGVIVQDIRDLGFGVQNWEEGLRRYNVDMKDVVMAYIIDDKVPEEHRRRLIASKPPNVILVSSLEEVRGESIVYLARRNRLEQVKRRDVTLVERGNAGPVIELNLCLWLLDSEDINPFLEKLVNLGFVTREEIKDVVKDGYIKLPRIEKVLKMWDELQKDISYLDVWA